ncbi:unknown [Firmicutes bacterium CAG:170]|nr:unknown [Firmicutes bacterium CAG:170]
MAQRVGLRIGIAEGNVAELDAVVVVVALFHRQGALIHGIRDVKIGEKALEVLVVGHGDLPRTHKAVGRRKQQHDARNVLRDGTDADPAAQRAGDQQQIDAEAQHMIHQHFRQPQQCAAEIGARLPAAKRFIEAVGVFGKRAGHGIEPDILAAGVVANVGAVLIQRDIHRHAVLEKFHVDRGGSRARQHGHHDGNENAADKGELGCGSNCVQRKERGGQRDGGEDLHAETHELLDAGVQIEYVPSHPRFGLDALAQQRDLAVLDRGIRKRHRLFRVHPLVAAIGLLKADLLLRVQHCAEKRSERGQTDGQRGIADQHLHPGARGQRIDQPRGKPDRDVGQQRRHDAVCQNCGKKPAAHGIQQPPRAACDRNMFPQRHASAPPV